MKTRNFMPNWVRHVVTVPTVERTFTVPSREGEITKHEMVAIHDCYRKKLPNGKAETTRWHRGAIVNNTN